ncbi:MAG: reverse transcriptase/ribonuclease H family protein, partial [Sediminibacterium sp.]
MHPVAKMDENGVLVDVRITCNAKQLNKALIQQKRHIPSIPELTNELKGCEWFSSLDLKDAFNQIMFELASRPLTAMSTIWGIYLWNRLNMGISIASEIFQEIMEKVLEGIPYTKIALDDLMVHTLSYAKHEEIIKMCLDRLAENGLTLNLSKCKFFKSEIDFFGVTISKNGIKPKKGKFQDLQECKPPTSTKEVHSFLGLTGYFKNRSPYQSSIDKPLRNLLKKDVPFKWDRNEQQAYEKLKATVIEKEMAFFDHKLETELYVEAGPDGCSSFLTQINQSTNDIKLIRCDSHSFNEAEINYSHLEKEAFACVWACKTNHIYVYGRRFKCITDALSVKKIFEEDKTRKRTPIRFVRWKSDLSIYNVEFVHRSGSKNIADYLSRRFNKPSSNITN